MKKKEQDTLYAEFKREKRKEIKSCFRSIHFFLYISLYFIPLGFYLQHKEGPVFIILTKHKRTEEKYMI